MEPCSGLSRHSVPPLHHLQSPPASLNLTASLSHSLTGDMKACPCPHAQLNHVVPAACAHLQSCGCPEAPGDGGSVLSSSHRSAVASLCQSCLPAPANGISTAIPCCLLGLSRTEQSARELLSHGVVDLCRDSRHWNGIPRSCPGGISGGTGRGCTAAVRSGGVEPLTHPRRSNDPARLGCRIRNGLGCVSHERARPASCG